MASKLQRDPADGKCLRDPATGKLLRDADDNACCCGEGCCSENACVGLLGDCCTPDSFTVNFADLALTNGCFYCPSGCAGPERDAWFQAITTSLTGPYCLEQVPGSPCIYRYTETSYTANRLRIWDTADCTGSLLWDSDTLVVEYDVAGTILQVYLSGTGADCFAPSVQHYIFVGLVDPFDLCDGQTITNDFVDGSPCAVTAPTEVSELSAGGTARMDPCCEEDM